MDFCRRAQIAVEREEPAQALMTLVHGLRRHPEHSDAVDLLLFVYTRHIDQPGLESEILRGLERHPDRDLILGFVVDEFRNLDKGAMASAVEDEARQSGVSIRHLAVDDDGDDHNDDSGEERELDIEISTARAAEESTGRKDFGGEAAENFDGDSDMGRQGDDDRGEEPADTDLPQHRVEDGGSEAEAVSSGARETIDEAPRRRLLFGTALAALALVVAGSVGFYGWQHARDVRELIAVDEAMIAFDPMDAGEVRQVLEEAKTGPGPDTEIEEREQFVDALSRLEGGGDMASFDEAQQAPTTSWGGAARALQAAGESDWERAMRFVHHLEEAHDDTLPAYYARGRVCEARGDWECALQRYRRVQTHFEEFIPARLGAMRIGGYRFDVRRWEHEREQLSEIDSEHPYASLTWVDPFDDMSSFEGVDVEIDDDAASRGQRDRFVERWEAMQDVLHQLDQRQWSSATQICDQRSEESPPIPAFAISCGYAAAGEGDATTAFDRFVEAARIPSTESVFRRRLQTRAPILLADLGRADLGLELALPYDLGAEVEAVIPGGDAGEEAGVGDDSDGLFEPVSKPLDGDDARALLTRAQTLVAKGRTDGARRILSTLANRDDIGDEARFERAWSYLVDGNRNSAMSAIDEIDDDERRRGAESYRAYLEGRHSDAYEVEAATDEDQRITRVRALSFLADGRGRHARTTLDAAGDGLDALRLRPVQLRVFARSRSRAGLDELRDSVGDMEDVRTLDVLVDVAGSAFWQRDFTDSARWLQRVLQAVPDHPEAHWKSGLLRRAEGDEQAAESHFRQAWRGDQDSPEWLIESGWVHLDSGRYDRARQVFLLANLRDREDTDAVEGLGKAYYQSNHSRGRRDLEELLGNYTDAAGEQPARAEMKRWQAVLYGARQGDREALPYLEAARDTGGDRVSILVELGRFSGANEQWDEAREYYGRALRVDPTRPEIHLGLARVAQVLGDEDSARQHLQRVVNLVPTGEFGEQARVQLSELEESAP